MGAHDHLYGHRWRTARARHLALHPLCVMCAAQGRVEPATVVDHIEPHRGDTGLFWDASNWQALCTTCHDGAKKSFERTGSLRGSTLAGLPLDTNHPWFREGAEA